MNTAQKSNGGFAALSQERRIEIARMGGKAAWEPGRTRRPHTWTSEEARAAGRKGGRISRPRKKRP